MVPALREVTLPALRRIGRISAQGLLAMNNGRMIEATTTTPQTPARGHIAAQWRGSLAGCSRRRSRSSALSAAARFFALTQT